MARVVEGAEPFRMEGEEEVGVLVCHGFAGTPQSVRPLGEGLARAGFTVAGPRLAGHGTTVRDLAKSTASDWISSIEEDIDWLQERADEIFFVGQSVGGTFALYFAAMRPELLRGIVTINACVFLEAPELSRLVFDENAPETAPGFGSDIKASGAEELAYPEIPLPAVKELMALLRVTDDLLPTIETPALMFQSVEDHVVPPENGSYIQSHLASRYRQLARLENSYHVATLDNDANYIAEQTIRFIVET
ncbi:MAG: alpha/beta hydrolase [Rubrobacteraceae bacterium]